jgi:hypothetical protein
MKTTTTNNKTEAAINVIYLCLSLALFGFTIYAAIQ